MATKVKASFSEAAREAVDKWIAYTKDRFAFDLEPPRLKIESIQPEIFEDRLILNIEIDDSTPKETMEKYREHMVKTLREARWIDIVLGLVQCPVCFSVVHESSRQAHEIWHERGNYL